MLGMSIPTGLDDRPMFGPKNLPFLILVLFALTAPAAMRAVADGGSPNVVFILVDDLGVRDLGCYGSSFHESPRIDQLAREGMLFRNAYASHAVCGPSRQAILTGRTPARLGVVATTGNIRSTDYTWPERFQEAGYRTCFLGKWHLGDGESVLRHGFDRNIAGGELGQPADFYYPYRSHVRRTTFDVPDMEDGQPGDYLTDALTTKALAFIEDNRDQPFLLYLSYYAVHKPAIPGVWAQGKRELTRHFEQKLKRLPPSDGPLDREVRHGPITTIEALQQRNPEFASQILALDANVGRVLDKIDALGLTENTLVVFTSDQGSVTNSHERVSSAQPYHLGKSWLFDGGLRVPLIVRWPGRVAAGRESALITYNTDLFPTLLDLVGWDPMPKRHVDGVSIAPTLRGGNQSFDRPYYWVYTSLQKSRQAYRCVAYREGNYKLIHWFQLDHTELYDLAADPGETHDLAAERPAKRDHLLQSLMSYPEVAAVVNASYRRS